MYKESLQSQQKTISEGEKAEATYIFKDLIPVSVWILLAIGCLSTLMSPVIRYITGVETYLWISLGVGVFTLSMALVLSEIVKTPE